MQNGKPILQLGIVGVGAIAQAYLQAIEKSETVKLTAVADVSPKSLAAAATSTGAATFSSHQALAQSGLCDAVVVCTPPYSHPEVACDLLDQGIHILCEKPFAVDVAGAQQMVGAAARSGAVLTMASKFRFVEDVAKAKALVDAGAIGEVVLFENTFTSNVDMSCRWNSDPLLSGGGVLIDNGAHSVDILRFFLGPLAEIQTIEAKRIQDIPVEDTVFVFVRSVHGVMGHIDLSWSIDKQTPHFIRIYGSQGIVLVGWKESKYRRFEDDQWTKLGSGYDKIDAFRRQLDNFARAIRGEETLRITLTDALGSVEVIDAAYKAMWSDRWMSIDRRLSHRPAAAS